MNELFVYLEDITVNPRYLKGVIDIIDILILLSPNINKISKYINYQTNAILSRYFDKPPFSTLLQQTQPTYGARLESNPGHWWQASALTTAPSLFSENATKSLLVESIKVLKDLVSPC